ncbi:MAG: hypothetical protein WA734_09895, partial [Candidatus Acidiferrales bacterium]
IDIATVNAPALKDIFCIFIELPPDLPNNYVDVIFGPNDRPFHLFDITGGYSIPVLSGVVCGYSPEGAESGRSA